MFGLEPANFFIQPFACMFRKVCESDFTKGLTEMTAAEEQAAAEYEAYMHSH